MDVDIIFVRTGGGEGGGLLEMRYGKGLDDRLWYQFGTEEGQSWAQYL